MDKSDSQLLRRLRRKDDEATAAVLNRFKKKIKNYIESKVPRDGRADDLAQNTFLKFFELIDGRGLGKYESFDSIEHFLFAVATTQLIDDTRKEISRREMQEGYATYPMTRPRRPDEIL